MSPKGVYNRIKKEDLDSPAKSDPYAKIRDLQDIREHISRLLAYRRELLATAKDMASSAAVAAINVTIFSSLNNQLKEAVLALEKKFNEVYERDVSSATKAIAFNSESKTDFT